MCSTMFATTMNIYTLARVDREGGGGLGMLYTVMVDCWDQMNYRLSKPFHLLSSCYVLEVFVLFIKVSLVTGLNEMVEWDMEGTNKFTFVGVAGFRLSYLIHLSHRRGCCCQKCNSRI